MPSTESYRPDEDLETAEETTPTESVTKLKEEQTVFCSPGARSPVVDRILGFHLPGFGSERPSDDHDEHYPPFLLVASLEDEKMIEFSEKASDCGISVEFLNEQVMADFEPMDYYTMLSQWIHLVLYHAKKIEGGKWPGVRPIAPEELNQKAMEEAKTIVMRAGSIASLEEVAAELRAYMQGLSNKV